MAWITEGDPLFYSTFQHVLAEVRSSGAGDEDRDRAWRDIDPSGRGRRRNYRWRDLADQVAVVAGGLRHRWAAVLLDEFATIVLLKVHAVFDELLDALDALERRRFKPRTSNASERLRARGPRPCSLRGTRFRTSRWSSFAASLVRRNRLAWSGPMSGCGNIAVVGLGPGAAQP